MDGEELTLIEETSTARWMDGQGGLRIVRISIEGKTVKATEEIIR
ncbi:MAG: hypothetical protein ACLR23_07550 [Clostridia bacterium]